MKSLQRLLLALAVPCLAFSLRAQVAGPEDDSRSSFEWKGTYAEGLAAAVRRSRPFVIYLPPARADEEPAVIRKLPQLAGSPPVVEGVRASAEEVLGFMDRFKLKKLPALVLVDRRGNAIAGWEGGLPADVWSKLLAAVRRQEKREEEDARTLAEARRAADQGQFDPAYRKAQPLLESPRTAPETLDGARRIEEELLLTLGKAARRILASEGLKPSESVLKELETLRASTSHAAFKAECGREIEMLRGRTVGAE